MTSQLLLEHIPTDIPSKTLSDETDTVPGVVTSRLQASNRDLPVGLTVLELANLLYRSVVKTLPKSRVQAHDMAVSRFDLEEMERP
jgi:hypothetical protein